jgi:aryl-alcohol dehydrogenase-like predicted oxidoreductase
MTTPTLHRIPGTDLDVSGLCYGVMQFNARVRGAEMRHGHPDAMMTSVQRRINAVIPAKAGIQSESPEGEAIARSCRGQQHGFRHWIPAFAGMTMNFSRLATAHSRIRRGVFEK